MAKRVVVAITMSHDDHVEAFSQRFNSEQDSSIHFVRINSDTLSDYSQIEITKGIDRPHYLIRDRNDDYSLADITSIWIRKPGIETLKTHVGRTHRDEYGEFKYYEFQSVYRSFIDIAENTGILTVNPIWKIIRANTKPIQLEVAQQLGFRIPKTLISVDKVSISKFIHQNNNLAIIKNINQSTILDGNSLAHIATYEVSREFFDAFYANKELNYPLLLQEVIPKAYELRITVIGIQVLACRIDSQNNTTATRDWRTVDARTLRHTQVELPEEIRSRCIQIVKAFGLQYGAIDMAVTPEGEYVFFEVNPNGQYLWMENICGIPLTQAMENLLTNPTMYKLV